MVTDIIKVLFEAISAREQETGKHPTALYLGSLQWKELMEWAEGNAGFKSGKPWLDVPVFNGCKVYMVNVFDHVGVV